MVTRTDGGGSPPTYSYYGFIPDLVFALSKRLRFDYELYNVSGGYGQLKNRTNEWTGMIGEVMRRDVRITFILFHVIFSAFKFVNSSEPASASPKNTSVRRIIGQQRITVFFSSHFLLSSPTPSPMD